LLESRGTPAMLHVKLGVEERDMVRVSPREIAWKRDAKS